MQAKDTAIIDWLMAGDVAIQYQTRRDLLGEDDPVLRRRIASEGWGRAFLAARNRDGSWGEAFYRPKWACTHYTLLELAGLGFPPDHPGICELITRVAQSHGAKDGGLGHTPGYAKSDICINGMFLNYASYFGVPDDLLHPIIDFLLRHEMADGGFNCMINRSGAVHSSLHSTLSVLEGFHAWHSRGGRYRAAELAQAAADGRAFILRHQFHLSDRTGRLIHPSFLALSHPPRWRYNILRALDHFRAARQPYDPRMRAAIAVLIGKRRSDGRWRRGAAPPGKRFFEMEPPRQPSRWVTLLALRVLAAYAPNRA